MAMSEGYCSFRFIEQVIKNTKHTINPLTIHQAETLVPCFHNYTD